MFLRCLIRANGIYLVPTAPLAPNDPAEGSCLISLALDYSNILVPPTDLLRLILCVDDNGL